MKFAQSAFFLVAALLAIAVGSAYSFDHGGVAAKPAAPASSTK
jgi:hypothetical protein